MRDLTGHAHRTVNPDLRTAGAELVHALTEMVLDGTAVADATTIAKRVDLTSTARTSTDALDSPDQISMILLDAALDPRTRVSARGPQQLLGQLTADPDTSPQNSWVDPRDLAACREMALPAPIRGAITSQFHDVEATSHALAAAVTAGHVPNTAPSSDQSRQEGNPPVRTLHRTGSASPRAASTPRR